MPEAHMRRKTSRRRGRPRGRAPLFVEDCVRVDATELLAKSRGGSPDDGLIGWPVTFTWTEYGQTRERSIWLTVTSTVQPLGGVRRWWKCPHCGRRCRVLLIASAESPVACRRCLGAVYSADYPDRHQLRQIAALLHGFLGHGLIPGIEKRRRESDFLLAKRRRGVRRGRRLAVRALRQIRLIGKEPDLVASLLGAYK